MTIKNKIIAFCLVMLFGKGVNAQFKTLTAYPDTLTMVTDSGTEIIFAFKRVSKKEKYISNDLWKSTISIMETTILNSDIEGGKLVTYDKVGPEDEEKAKIEVSPLKVSEIYVIGSESTEEKSLDRAKFVINQDLVKVSFYVNDLSAVQEIKDIKIETFWDQIEEKYTNEGKVNLYSGTGTFKYGTAKVDKIIATSSGKDNLEINFIGVGLGFYRDRFVADLSSKLSLNMHNRLGEDWISFGVIYTQQYFFEDGENQEFDPEVNGWLSGFFKLKLGSRSDIGFGMGALIHREGDFYKGGTYKFSIFSKGEESRLSFSPELVFTNDFKQAFPAVRIGLSF